MCDTYSKLSRILDFVPTRRRRMTAAERHFVMRMRHLSRTPFGLSLTPSRAALIDRIWRKLFT